MKKAKDKLKYKQNMAPKEKKENMQSQSQNPTNSKRKSKKQSQLGSRNLKKCFRKRKIK